MFRTVICLVLLCSIPFVSYAQTQEINFIQTEEHIEIPGTQYMIIPPDESFTISSDFHGMQGADESSALNITEMPMSFETVVPMFAKDMPEDQLMEEMDYMINGNNVKIYKIEKIADPSNEDSAMKFWMMLYGNEKVTFLLAATYESSKEETYSAKFEKSLLSFMYLEDKEVDPQAGLSFSLDMSNTPLQFASLMAQTGAVFNLDGELMSKNEDKTSYMVMVMPVAIEKEEQKDSAIGGVKRKYRDENVTVKEVNPITLGGLDGYEVIGYEEDETKGTTLKYAIKLFDKDKYYDIRAASEMDLEKRLEMFKMISRTFKLK